MTTPATTDIPPAADKTQPIVLRQIAADDELIEIGRKAIEDNLIEWRDARMSAIGRGNGLVVNEVDGQPSKVIRFGPEVALRIGLKAIATRLEQS